MNQIKSGLWLAAVCATFAGCSSTPVAPPAAPAPVVNAMPSAAPVAPTAAPEANPTASTSMLPAYLDPKSLISTERSVYFDFDDFSIKDKYTALIERQGKYLSTMAALSVKVEGNTDERGSSEYNLALGQRRAEAVVKALKVYGARDKQLEPVSWGKEHASGHDEPGWAQDRRADIVYPKK